MSQKKTNHEPAPLDAEIRHATLVHAAPGRVYDALTTASSLDGWFTHGASVEPHPGGEIRFRWVNWGPDRVTDEDGGPVLEARRPERFVFQWRPDPSGSPTTVEIDICPVEGGTRVDLHEYCYQDTPRGRAALANCAAGWGEALTLMKFYVEHGLRYE